MVKEEEYAEQSSQEQCVHQWSIEAQEGQGRCMLTWHRQPGLLRNGELKDKKVEEGACIHGEQSEASSAMSAEKMTARSERGTNMDLSLKYLQHQVTL